MGTIHLRFGKERYRTTLGHSTCLGRSSTNNETLKKFKLNQRLLRETEYKFSRVPEGLLTGSEDSTPVKLLGKKFKDKKKPDSDSDNANEPEENIKEDTKTSKSKVETRKGKEKTDEKKTNTSEGKLSRNGQYWIDLNSDADCKKYRTWLYELMKQNQVSNEL